MTRRVVITGLGLVTPVGNTVEDTWTALMSGRSGADYIKKFDAERFSVKFACEVKNFDPLTFIAKKEARKMGAFIHYAIAASIEAMADSGLPLTPEGKFPDDIAENAAPTSAAASEISGPSSANTRSCSTMDQIASRRSLSCRQS